MAEQTKKRLMITDDETWNLKLKWGPKNTHLQLPLIAIGVAKDNEINIFEIIIYYVCRTIRLKSEFVQKNKEKLKYTITDAYRVADQSHGLS